jgi:2-dehydro-3-deoxyphosphogluconate aldolase/(4S)-4-hydroxy-2-oxoglutarate aldolase
MKTIEKQLQEQKLIPVIAIDNAEDIIPLGKALAENGLNSAEITFRSEAAPEAIRLLREAQPEMLIGAGTVLTAEQVEQAKAAGATFIVSPGFKSNTARACQELEIDYIPGVNNPTAIEAALKFGLTMLKFFPAEASGGITMLKALLAPYKMIKIMPTGGVNLNNINDYLALDRVVACGGTWMVDSTLIAEKQWDKIGKLAHEAYEKTS